MHCSVVGMGLIGGSIAKAVSAFTSCKVYGFDKDEKVIEDAISRSVITRQMTKENIKNCSLIIVALYPELVIDFLREYAPYISKSSVVIDCSGVKKYVCDRAEPIAREYGFTFIGCHPMAGLHFSGYAYSTENLFKGASFIMCPDESVPTEKVKFVEDFFLQLGFGSIKLSTADEHDKIIAFTSQLCHIVSNAYVKNSAADEHMGFSAGSYKDLTRIAKLNENMWTELFLENRDNLIYQLDELIGNLTKYSMALKNEDYNDLHELLKEGRIRKETIDGEIYRD